MQGNFDVCQKTGFSPERASGYEVVKVWGCLRKLCRKNTLPGYSFGQLKARDAALDDVKINLMVMFEFCWIVPRIFRSEVNIK